MWYSESWWLSAFVKLTGWTLVMALPWWHHPKHFPIITRPHAAQARRGLQSTDRVAWSVTQSVCNDREPCKNGWTNRDAIYGVDSGGPKEPSIRWWSRSPHVNEQVWGQKGAGPRTCLDMSDSRYTQSNSAGGSTGMVQMPIVVY